jgi:hypothetical protein
MEKGKRMKFNGVAKIVILAIAISAIMGITAIEATTFSVGDCPKCPESEIKLTSGHDYTSYLQCFYYSSDIPSIEGADGRIYVHEYSSAERATNAFRDMCQYYMIDTQNAEKILSDDDTKFVYMVYSKEFPDIQIHGFFFHSDGNVIIEVSIYTHTFVCAIDSEITKAKKRFDAFAKCAHSITGWEYVPILPEAKPEAKEEYTLTLKHYPPYYKPEKDDPRRAGDLVATLIDKDGNGVSDKTVFFYVEPGTNLKGVLEYPLSPPNDWIRISHNFPGVSYVGYAYTSNKGIARFNYIRHRCIKADILSKRIRDTGENIKGPVVAAVFNQELTAIEQEASVDIELSSVARITNISIHGEQCDILGKKGKILFTRINKKPITVHERDCLDKGYDLLCDDVISLDKDDCIELMWFDGMKIKIKTKPHVLEEDMVDITIGKRELAHQLSRDMYDFRQHDLFSTITLGGAGAILGFCALPIIVPTIGIPAATVGAIGYPALALGLVSIGIAFEGIYYGETPFVLSRMKSIILVDPTSSGINFYTIEGDNELITPKGFKRNITTGHKISLLPDGTFSQISEFDRSELNEELSYLLDSIEKDESGTTAAPALTPKQSELKISKLYVGKPIYPRGTEVDIYYDVKNIGTVDVDEYHVECRINDLKGNEVYKFVGSTHNIASGKRQKFVAAEKWKIPSDAKIGPYIIDCTLIWDSKKDTAGREFFVTHPAKREDRTAELEISNLYTVKSEYLKGAGERVDVCYYVKNTGTVDISEYHVIYQIFDSEGKRYCWFISDMFGSIVAGKKDKWQSGVWNVPSDAKVGRYTVDAMVIWGLDRFSRETAYFFVK